MITTKVDDPDRRETTGNPTDESTLEEQVMYPLEMNPLMRELCAYYGQLWRAKCPFESDLDLDDAEIAKAFLQSAAEIGLARLVETEPGHAVWEATPMVFHDIGGLDPLWFRRRSPGDEEINECAEDGRIKMRKTKKLVRDLDQIADRLMYTADEMAEALGAFSRLRQLAFHLSVAIGEDPFKDFRPKQAETPEQNVSKPPPGG